MEDEYTYSPPSPADTPYRSPSSSRSQRSHRDDDMSPSSTPPPVSEDRSLKRRSNDSVNPALDESISPLDPRRFTPTLHASLVSEILSLRRDLENRTKDIERLESSLHQAQTQNDLLNSSLLSSNKETRTVKRQMQLLEGGTLSAINDLAKERDEALGDVSDLRRRLDQSQKRAKTHEDNADRMQQLWDKDKEVWLAEKRGLETKVNITEGRLKVVLNEFANAQHVAPPGSPERRSQSRNSILESPGKGSLFGRRGRRTSTGSVTSDHIGGRMSVLSFANGVSTNLADELAFDEEDEIHGDFGESGRISPDALPEEQIRPASSLSLKARKVLGLAFDLDDHESHERRKPRQYVDTAMQSSPPPSPHTEMPPTKSLYAVISTQVDANTSTDEANSSPSARNSVHQPVMVSAACQTVEALPSPPPTPDKTDAVLATIHESVLERSEMSTTGTQTEPVKVVSPSKSWHSTRDSNDLQIPLIAIIPPTSRPATPESHVVLPPRTKNASAQVTIQLLGTYISSSMQTEEIRVDRRTIIPPPPAVPSVQPAAAFKAPVIPPRSMAPPNSRRKTSPTFKMFGSKKSTTPSVSSTAPVNDDGPLARGVNLSRPERISSMFAGFDEEDEQENFFNDEFLQDDDIFSRPSGRFVLKAGKLVSQDLGLEDIGETSAAMMGEAAALETLRLSEDSLPPDMRSSLSSGRTSPRRRSLRSNPTLKQLRRIPSARGSNMRRAALISSGTAAHRSSHSQSTNASFDSNNPPPFPVPLRYSSARIGKSVSEGGRSSPGSSAASPTRRIRHRSNKPILRKARSGPAISPHAQTGRGRSQSPSIDPRVSIVPEMPSFQMPVTNPASFLNEPYTDPREASAPRPSVATGPSRRATSHGKTSSDVVSMQQTSVVDSIAQTMVGEWMYKYVRRRKSFGVTDKNEWDPNKNIEELSASVTNGGVRHKRWVWLAPYERAVMWSSKQPVSGSALMGKSGRKLVIKSVLDVKDDNPMPKGSIGGPHFNRSILILTPQRALKFTATSRDRHYVWLTALSFLSHSPLSVNDLTAIPPPPEDLVLEPPPPPSLAGSLRRRPIRDSIRIAKTSNRPGLRSFTTDGYDLPERDEYERPVSREYYDPNVDPALPPTIKRFHARKRSNTAPRAPPSSFRTFSAKDTVPSLPPPSSTYAHSVLTTTNGSSVYTPSLGMQSLTSSRRGSEASASGRPMVTNLFPEFTYPSTMRMDAFIDTKPPPLPQSYTQSYVPPQSYIPPQGQAYGGPSYEPSYGPPLTNRGIMLRSGTLKKKDVGYWGIEEGRQSISPVDSLQYGEMLTAGSSARASVDSRDPFRGF